MSSEKSTQRIQFENGAAVERQVIEIYPGTSVVYYRLLDPTNGEVHQIWAVNPEYSGWEKV